MCTQEGIRTRNELVKDAQIYKENSLNSSEAGSQLMRHLDHLMTKVLNGTGRQRNSREKEIYFLYFIFYCQRCWGVSNIQCIFYGRSGELYQSELSILQVSDHIE